MNIWGIIPFSSHVACIIHFFELFCFRQKAVYLEGGVSIVKRNVKLAVPRIHVNSLTVSVKKKKVKIYFLYIDNLIYQYII